MNETAARERCVEAPSRELWQSIPLDMVLSAVAILVAAGLTIAGIFPG